MDIISYHLKKKNYQPLMAADAGSAMDLARQNEISAAVLDVMMPGMDGFALCRAIRARYYFPILFLTAKAQEKDKLEGLRCGGDDYMVKPFSSMELLARIDSLVRRYTQYNSNRAAGVRIGNLHYDRTAGVVSVNGRRLDLTDIEYRILVLLLNQEGRPLNAERIYAEIWGEHITNSSGNNVVVHVKNIRKKISCLDKEVEYIHTVWGKGYSVYV